ncbi:hypothetical protein [Novosphingobium sp. Gsoil 351]|uniref:beta strand repeat-containing protein n=1 Tax=Novosphingobium sp. Gsoil 351 TaxID=2675225 RepID=UPI0012B478D5|nr:hypothetical protein [Novosphingobium sp. Gsoil 351]QGN53482.1 hypothetical protein GKE62_01890 [Novosphingobium sp. Gsoil 351]
MTKRQVAQHKPGTTMAIGGPVPRSRTSAPVGLAGLLAGVSVSAAALALATVPQQARAQSAVNATPVGINAVVTQSSTLDQVTVSGTQATVDWALNPTGVSSGVFLNGGTQLDFQGSGSFTVLNRVDPMGLTGTLALNGSVTSSNPQGKIWFYNPGGWVVGGNATIDVGSLVLTSNPIKVDNDGNPGTLNLYGLKGEIRFGQAMAGSSITNNGTIFARQEDSYVALVAPRVVQAGTVTNNGSTAYVAAGAVDITINNGLFDIVVSSGTDDSLGQGVVHTGTTLGSTNSNSSSAASHRIYLAAVPKNDAMTMLVSGNIGYNSASSASTSGGKIVLSSGYNVGGDETAAGEVAPAGNITLTELSSLQSTTLANAANRILVDATSSGRVSAQEDLSLTAGKRIDLVAFGEGGVFVNGALSLNAGAGAKGGIVDVSVDGGAELSVGNFFEARADGEGAVQSDGDALVAGAAGEAAMGGTVTIALGDAFYSVGQTFLSANAQGGLGGASAGAATAGTVRFSSTSGTTFSNSGFSIDAIADASTPDFFPGPEAGAEATGGSIDLAFGGSFDANSITASTSAYADQGNNDVVARNASAGSVKLAFTGPSTVTLSTIDLDSSVSGANGGSGLAGDVTMSVSGGATANARNLVALSSEGTGGDGRAAGDGIGGKVLLSIADGRVATSRVDVESTGYAGQPDSGGTRTGTGIGGNAAIELTNPGSQLSASSIYVAAPGLPGFSSVDAFDGLAAFDVLAVPGAGGGNGEGGIASVTIDAGQLSADTLEIDASGEGGDGFDGGDGGLGRGGAASFTSNGGNTSLSSILITADGRGGFGASSFGEGGGAPGGAGGAGFGGSASLLLNDGALIANSIALRATGNAPQTISFGEGGSFVIEYGGGGTVEGYDPATGGVGGLGMGGTTTLAIAGGSLSNSSSSPVNSITLDSRGVGGNGGDAFSYSSDSRLTRGSGGTGMGGSAAFSYSGRDANFSSIEIDASGSGGSSGSESGGFFTIPSNGGNGGSGVGGNASITLGSANSFGSTRFYSAEVSGQGADGGDGVIGGAGGAGRGGTAEFAITAAGVFADQFALDASGEGGSGGASGLDNTGGAGGAGKGGSVELAASGDGVGFTVDRGSLYADGQGGRGGEGGSGESEVLDAAGKGGDGGAGFGGTVRFSATDGATLDVGQTDSLDVDADGSGGTGGNGGFADSAIGDGGNGGAGTGGGIEVAADDGTVLLGDANAGISGTGGDGGGNLAGENPSTDASNGGNGGAGTGGVFSLTASGSAGSIQANSLDISVDGSGGGGIDGRGFDPVTFIGASGGAGAAGTGGTIRLDALNQGTITIGTDSSSTLTAKGSAAFGGSGASGGTNPTTGVGGAGGTGGNSGQGNGGTVVLNAEGGLIEAGDLNLFVNGYGAGGSQGGAGGVGIVPPGSPQGTPPGADGAFGAFGIGGGGVGGTVTITAQRHENGAVGGLDVGAVSLDLTGLFDFGDFRVTDISGTAQISDTVDESNGGVNFASLNVAGAGDPMFNPITLSVLSSEAPIRVAGSLSAGTGGTIDIIAIGTGGLDVTGQLNLSTDSSIRIVSSQGGLVQAGDVFLSAAGTTLISAQNCNGPLCSTVRADGQFSASTGGDFKLNGPAEVEAGNDLQVFAGGNVTGEAGSGYRAPSIFITAQNDVTIRNASGGTLRTEAGSVSFGEGGFQNGNLTLGEDDGSGVFDLSGSLFGTAGTSIDVTAKTTIDTGNLIDLSAGDDVRIGSGATLTNTTGGSEPGSISLAAGAPIADVSYPDGNVASLLIGSGATVDGTGGSVTLSGGAIDGRDSILRGADIAADVLNPPALGTAQLTDNGQLTAPCIQGDICLGPITAIGAVRIGQGSSAPVTFTGTGHISGGSVAITSRETLTYGAAASPFTISSSGPIALISQNGDVALVGNALIDGGTVALSANGSVTGDGRLRSVDDVGIDVGDSIALDSLTAGGQLTTVAGIGGALEPLYALPGNLAIGSLQTGAPTAINAGGSIMIGTATSGGNDLALSAGTLVSLDASSNIASLTLDGGDVAFAAVAANGDIVLSATNAVTGGSAVAGGALNATGATLNATTLRSGGAMTLTTTGATTLGSATAGGDLAIDSGPLSFSQLTSTGAVTIAATSVAGGDIAAGTSLDTRSAGPIVLGTATAGTTLALDAASVTAATLRSGGAMMLNTTGAANVGSAAAGGGLNLATGALTFASLTSTGATGIVASAVTGGDIAAGSTLSIATPNAIKLGAATAGGSLTLNGATIAADTLRSGAATSLTSGAATTLGTATAGTTFTSTAGALQFVQITATGEVALNAGTANGGDATSTTGAIALTTGAAATLGQLRAATDVTARATTLNFAGINAGRDVTLDVTTLAGTAIATGRDLTIRGVDDLTFGTIAAGRNISLAASTGAITVNTDIDAGGSVALAGDAILVKAAGPLTVAAATADNGDVAISTDGLLQVGNALARGDVTLTSTANSLILGPITGGRSLAVPSALNAGGTSKGTPGTGAITLSAAQSITMQGTVDALTSLAATAGTLIDQRSLAVGKTIAYRSADLALGQTATLGQSNFTMGIALTNTGNAGAILGDVSGTGQGYRLDNAEFGRIHSGGDLSMAGGSSLIVGTLAASAATGGGGSADGNIGATSALALSASGDLSVGAALALANAAGNTMQLTSGTLTLDAGAGSVRLIEGAGHGGTLAISTGDLTALTSAARSAISGMDGNAVNLRLAQNDGVSDGRTLLEAGSIAISASGRVLIQNTAVDQTFDGRRGFVADSFAINTSGASSTGAPLIVINGTVAGQTGLNALRAVQVTGGFDSFSTVNGCRLLAATCGAPKFDPIQDVIEEEVGRGSNLDSGDAIGEGMLIQIERFEPVGFEAVIDEPVTGSGNDDFLVPEAGTGDQQCEADDKTKCDKPPTG